MNEAGGLIAGLLFLFIGFLSIKFRVAAGKKAAVWYRKLGIDIREELYAKQFFFIGVLFIIVGFLAATDLLQHL
jgi:hypothetical protein